MALIEAPDRTSHILDAGKFGALDTSGSVDAHATIAAAITAANKAGTGGTGGWYSSGGDRIVMLPPGVFAISDLLTIPDNVQLRGHGSRSTILKCTSASAGLSFTGSGGHHGDFSIDGNNLATTGLLSGPGTQMIFENIDVRFCATTGLKASNTQNTIFAQVNCRDNGDTGILIDTQTNSCIFLRCEIEGNTHYGVQVKRVSGNVNNNVFDTCIFESSNDTAYVYLAHGTTLFRNCVWTPGSGCIGLKVGPLDTGSGAATAYLSDFCRFTCGTPSTAIQANSGATIWFSDETTFISGATVGFDNVNGIIRGFGPRITTTATPFQYGGGMSRDAHHYNTSYTQLSLQAEGSTDRMLYTQLASSVLFSFDASGKHLWSGDTNLYRSAADTLKTDDSFVAGGSISPQATAAKIYSGSGTPEGAITAAIGSIYLRTNGGAATSLYVKETGAGNTGWVGK